MGRWGISNAPKIQAGPGGRAERPARGLPGFAVDQLGPEAVLGLEGRVGPAHGNEGEGDDVFGNGQELAESVHAARVRKHPDPDRAQAQIAGREEHVLGGGATRSRSF